MARLSLILLAATFLLTGAAGRSEMLSGRESAQLMQRISDLLEVTRIVMPELSRAGAPLQENFQQGVKTLETSPNGDHTGIVYGMLQNAKAYLLLSDTLPKPAEFSEDIDRQLADLRDAIRRLEAHFRATLKSREDLALGSDRDNVRRYADDNQTIGPASNEGRRVVFLGDSITEGWNLDQYFTGRPYYNRGISGQITGQLLGRTKPDVADLQAAVVVVLGGTNDLARQVPDATIRNNLEAIGMLAESAGIHPVMASLLPVHDYNRGENPRFQRSAFRDPARIIELNRWLAALCKSKGWTFLDYHRAMIDADGRLRHDFSDDGLHPNTEGYKAMALVAQPAIDRVLQVTVRRPRRRGR